MKSIKLDNICFRYDDKVVFNEFNIEFGTGLTFLVGNNGSGKSTLFNIVKRNLPFMGNIYFDNKELKKNDDVLFLDMAYVKTLNGLVGDLIDDKTLTFLQLTSYRNMEISCLPLSLMVKVAFAMAIIGDEKAIFIDDILMRLNKNDRLKIIKKLKTLSKSKIVVVITNNLEDTLLGDRIVLLSKGVIILDDIPKSFYSNEKVLNEYKFQLPFMVDLSLNLKLYDIIDDIYFDQRKLVDTLWK